MASGKSGSSSSGSSESSSASKGSSEVPPTAPEPPTLYMYEVGLLVITIFAILHALQPKSKVCRIEELPSEEPFQSDGL